MISREVQIGDCRLLLGDSREIVPDLGEFDAVVSDPPFGMDFQSNHRKTKHRAIANDRTDCLLQWACGLSPQHSAYVFARWDNIAALPKPQSLVTWVKNNWSMGDLSHEHGRQTEVCLFYRGPGHFFPAGRPSDVIQCARTGNEYHPTEKPIGLMRAVVGWTSGTVFDPFMGSGTTGVACAKMGRSFVGVEIDEGYFEIACKRIRDAYAQPDFFTAPPVAPKQEAMEL